MRKLGESKLTNEVEVCKVMFLNTLGYKTDEILETVQKHTSTEFGCPGPSKRGKHTPKHANSPGDMDFIKEHIKKYNPSISHYRRALTPHRMYLPPELTIKDMYDDYKEACEADNQKCFSYPQYYTTRY